MRRSEIQSESARATTAAESRFRIAEPNSLPRAVKVVALDVPSEGVAKRLAAQGWQNASFFTASAFAEIPRAARSFSMQGWLSDLAGRTKDLIDEVASADLVVMIASAGENAQAAAIIGEACQLRHVMTTVLVLGANHAAEEPLAHTLAQLRPYANMLVTATSEDYIADMLAALRA
jgi:hypothetical protein